MKTKLEVNRLRHSIRTPNRAHRAENREHWAQAMLQQASLSLVLLELVAANRLQLNQGEPGLSPAQLSRLLKRLEVNDTNTQETAYLSVILTLSSLYPSQAPRLIPRLIKRLRNRVFHTLAKQKRQVFRQVASETRRYNALEMVSTTRVCSSIVSSGKIGNERTRLAIASTSTKLPG